jgi:hypothetical protein
MWKGCDEFAVLRIPQVASSRFAIRATELPGFKNAWDLPEQSGRATLNAAHESPQMSCD